MDTKKYNVALFDCFSFQYFKMGKSPKKGVFCFWFENIWGRVGTFCMHTVIMPVL
jgi:hypothetical protein